MTFYLQTVEISRPLKYDIMHLKSKISKPECDYWQRGQREAPLSLAQFYQHPFTLMRNTMGYFFLALTIIFESGAIIFMKLSTGFQNKSWLLAAVVTYILSFIFLTLALKNLPAGITNAIWAGSSTILVALAGGIIFKEHFDLLQLAFLLLIVIGIVGLSLRHAS